MFNKCFKNSFMKKIIFLLLLLGSMFFYSCDFCGNGSENQNMLAITVNNFDQTPASNVELKFIYQVNGVDKTIDLGFTNQEGNVTADVPINNTYILQCYYDNDLKLEKSFPHFIPNNHVVVFIPVNN